MKISVEFPLSKHDPLKESVEHFVLKLNVVKPGIFDFTKFGKIDAVFWSACFSLVMPINMTDIHTFRTFTPSFSS
jgi:hypothetical protein